MNKRANRVYWMLIIMVFLIGISIIIDCIRRDKNSTEAVAVNENTTEITEAFSEGSQETEETEQTSETTEGTTMDPAAAEEKIKSFYNGQVFVGDSIMSGFATYASKADTVDWFNDVVFLTKTSWGINSALDNDGPMYHGKSQNVCTSLGEIKPDKIFINLGVNEMNGLGTPGYSIEKLLGGYEEFINSVKEAVPESKIYIINIMPCTEDGETNIFKNSTIKEFNAELKEKCAQWGCEYLDLAGEFGESLDPELSSDDFVHHNDKSYTEKWVPFFEKLALSE